jgi:tRNA 2-thiouridine synthesizing protein A
MKHASPESGLTPDATLALNGLASPGPLPRIRQSLAQLRDGQILLLISDFPGIEKDMYAWARHTHNQILALDRDLREGLGFYILKGDPWPVDAVLDASGTSCPIPVIKADKALHELRPGETLKLITTCPASVNEIDTWMRATSHRLLGITEDVQGAYRFYIRKD